MKFFQRCAFVREENNNIHRVLTNTVNARINVRGAYLMLLIERGAFIRSGGANLKEGCLSHSSKLGPEDDSCHRFK